MKLKKSLLLMLCLVFISSMVLAACGGSDPATSDPEPTETNTGDDSAATEEPEEAAEGPKYGGDLVWGVIGSPTYFNPLWTNDVSSSNVENLVFDSLVVSDENFDYIPSMAESWDISDDGLIWTFYLKEGIKWHDGEDLTADDVVFSLSLPLHPDYDGPRASTFEDIVNIEALDDHTIQFELRRPNVRFYIAATFGILPKHILGDVPVAEIGEHPFNFNPIGSGPFKFDVWEDGQYVRVTAFDDYHDGRPYLDSITYKIVADQNALLAQLRAGDVDMMTIPASDIKLAREWEAQGQFKISSTLALSYTYLGYNLRNELFQDVKVRQAITHALDRDAMIAAVLDGDGQVAHAPASPLSWAYNPDTPKFEYDPEKAKQMLAEAGWEPGPDGILQKDGQRFSFTIKTNQGNKIREDLTVVIQQQLREVGIEATPQIVEFSALIDQINPPNRDFDAIVIGWSLSTDPDPTSIWHSKEIELGNNMIAYSRPDLDELMDINTEIVDLEERQQVIWQIFDEIANDQPYTFLYYPNSHRAMPTDLEGFIHHPRVEQYLAHKWWLDR